jgi:uncharacterized protein involved in oxidation of intracellular sulfur
MRIGIVLSTDEPELAWNALRLAVRALGAGHGVQCFLLARGVRIEQIRHPDFDVQGQLQAYERAGGTIRSCTTCLEHRGMEGSAACPAGSMHDLLALVEQCDKVLTFG